jgi:mono/diheme cytochrome c family protein
VSRAIVLIVLLGLAGCEQTFRNMYDQSKYKPLAASPLWADGRASRSPPDGAVAHAAGTFAGSSSGRLEPSEPAPVLPPLASVRDDLRPAGSKDAGTFRMPPITPALLQRGRERFDIFCAPCHSVAGDGDGFIARRGFPHPPSYHSDALRRAGDEHLYAVITNGYGAMYSYATRLTPQDRMAVVAYIRALQLSQHATLDDVPAAQRAALEARR